MNSFIDTILLNLGNDQETLYKNIKFSELDVLARSIITFLYITPKGKIEKIPNVDYFDDEDAKFDDHYEYETYQPHLGSTSAHKRKGCLMYEKKIPKRVIICDDIHRLGPHKTVIYKQGKTYKMMDGKRSIEVKGKTYEGTISIKDNVLILNKRFVSAFRKDSEVSDGKKRIVYLLRDKVMVLYHGIMNDRYAVFTFITSKDGVNEGYLSVIDGFNLTSRELKLPDLFRYRSMMIGDNYIYVKYTTCIRQYSKTLEFIREYDYRYVNYISTSSNILRINPINNTSSFIDAISGDHVTHDDNILVCYRSNNDDIYTCSYLISHPTDIEQKSWITLRKRSGVSKKISIIYNAEFLGMKVPIVERKNELLCFGSGDTMVIVNKNGEKFETVLDKDIGSIDVLDTCIIVRDLLFRLYCLDFRGSIISILKDGKEEKDEGDEGDEGDEEDGGDYGLDEEEEPIHEICEQVIEMDNMLLLCYSKRIDIFSKLKGEKIYTYRNFEYDIISMNLTNSGEILVNLGHHSYVLT